MTEDLLCVSLKLGGQKH